MSQGVERRPLGRGDESNRSGDNPSGGATRRAANLHETNSTPNQGPSQRPGKPAEQHHDASLGGVEPKGDEKGALHPHLLNHPTNTTWRANEGEKIQGFQKNEKKKK
jgi:hypothetical protein